MRQEAYFCTVKELDDLGKEKIPQQLISHTHLIYSSPATLAFNSPGAEGFGVKRAGWRFRLHHADRGAGMLRTKYICFEFHACVSRPVLLSADG